MPEERIVAPDPVAEPEAYQEALLDLASGRDPISILRETPGSWIEATKGLADDLLTTRPEPNEWSVHELLAHLFGAEVVYGFRWRLTLTAPGIAYPGYDQDAWAALPRPPFPTLLDAFASLREANVHLMTNTPEEEWDRTGLHSERGPESLSLSVQLLAGHDIAHAMQLHQTLAAVT